MDENEIQDIQDQVDGHASSIAEIKRTLAALSGDFYQNNFSASQDFQKASRFNTSLKIPNIDHTATPCDVGQVGEDGGKLYVCSAVNTWTVAGSQS